MTSPEAISKHTIRIIDASLNRIGEGLRLLEDVARLMICDVSITQQLKDIRHQLLTSDFTFQQLLVQARNVEEDIGTNLELSEEERQKDLPLVIVANARRVQESLRTLEELAKISCFSPELDSEKYKHARYRIYTLEKMLISSLLRQNKLEFLSGLYFILDNQVLKGRDYMDVAQQAINGGAKIIQLRDKVSSSKDLLPLANNLKKLCSDRKVLFIINDFLDLALASDADGIHLGQEDLPISTVRQLLPIDKIIGYSTHSMDQAVAAVSDGADYIAFGSIFPTTSKDSPTIVGLEYLRQIRSAIDLPIVAIGGIDVNNVAEVKAAGADSVAVISAILKADDIEKATRQIVDEYEQQ